MVRGDQKIVTFVIRNTGEETLKNARVESPSTSWMTLTVNNTLGDLKPGESRTVGVLFRPAEDLNQAVYDDRILILADNHIPYTYHLQMTVTSSAVGSVLFDVLNELNEDVKSASIRFQHQLLPELVYTAVTGPDGTVLQHDIPEGRYSYNISAPGHKSTSGSFTVYPGVATTVPVAMEVTLVQVEWSVTPVVIEDRYEIRITQTFQTNVPTAVIVVEPAGMTMPDIKPGEVFNAEYTITDRGLVAVDFNGLNFPKSISDYDIEVLSAFPLTLNSMQKITVPYRVKRRIQ